MARAFKMGLKDLTNYAAMFCILCGLVSCAPLRYKEPEGGNRTRVRFVARSDEITVLRAYEADGCGGKEEEWMRLRAGYLLNSVPKKLDMPLWDYQENMAKEVYVTADAPLHFMFFGSGKNGLIPYSCAVPFSYQFDRSVDYEVSYSLTPPNRCDVEVSRFAKNAERWQLVPQARFQNAVSDSDQECIRKFGKVRLF